MVERRLCSSDEKKSSKWMELKNMVFSITENFSKPAGAQSTKASAQPGWLSTVVIATWPPIEWPARHRFFSFSAVMKLYTHSPKNFMLKGWSFWSDRPLPGRSIAIQR